jgi:hypothetical protein
MVENPSVGQELERSSVEVGVVVLLVTLGGVE